MASSEKKRKCSSNGDDENQQHKRLRFNDDSDDNYEIEDSAPDIISDEAEVGIVERIFVVNFLCHSKLEVTPCSNVNFVIGRNGSGKSAILTALIVGLGGKATNTHRGNSLKDFIKDGCSFCQISITLRNRGTDAYKPEVYGKSIIVERKIHRDGGSTYKLKNCNTQKIVSANKSELVNILDQFNIQIDNPVSVLTQDTSRSFLNASDTRDKYSFFLKATHLEQISSDYQMIIEEKNLTHNLLSRKKSVIKDLSRQTKVWEEKYNDMKKLEEMRINVRDMKHQLAWAYVKDKKEVLDVYVNGVEDYQKRVPALEKEMEEVQVEVKKANEDLEMKKVEATTFEEEVTQILNTKTNLQKLVSEKKHKVKHINQSVSKTQKELKNAEKNKALLLEEIAGLKESAQKNYEEEIRQLEEAIKEKQDAINLILSQLSNTSHHLNQLNESIRKHQHDQDKLRKQIMESDQNMNKLKSQITQLQASQKNSLVAYGASTKNILQAIDKWHEQGKFHRKPIGPLGAYIKMKDEKWTIAVEKAIKNTITAYACHDSHDMLQLKKIFRSNCRETTPSIIVSRFGDSLYDVSRNKPANFIAIMDVITISNHIVANTLIDQSRIESSLLFEDAKYAQKIIWQQNPPSTKGYSKEGHEILGGRLSMYYPNNEKRVRFLQTDIKHTIRLVESDLIDAQRTHKGLIQSQNTITSQIRKDQEEIKKTKKKAYQEEGEKNRLELELQEIQNIDIGKPADLNDLEADVLEHETKICTLMENLEKGQQSLERAKEEQSSQEELYRKASDDYQAVFNNLELLANDTENLEKVFEEKLNLKAKIKGRLNKTKDKINQVKVKQQEAENDYKTTLAKAQSYCDEVEVKTSSEKLLSKIDAAQKRIEKEEKSRGSYDEIAKKYHDAKQREREAKSTIKEHITFLKCLDKAIERRAKRFEKFQSSLTRRTKKSFNVFLSQRGYEGKMEINHDDETLKIQVNVENMKGAASKDSKSLSGGERSFSTICFIMALWEAMEVPFRCLDEFDVFMDMLNRRISMNMLLELAKYQSHIQFILLTPQDMSHVASADRVRIFKLNDPERGQQTIPFEPST